MGVVVEGHTGTLLLCERVKIGTNEEPQRLPYGNCGELKSEQWHRAWAKRPFSFNACLDSRVASSVLSLTTMLYGADVCKDGNCVEAKSKPILLDACTGSGTIAATAA